MATRLKTSQRFLPWALFTFNIFSTFLFPIYPSHLFLLSWITSEEDYEIQHLMWYQLRRYGTDSPCSHFLFSNKKRRCIDRKAIFFLFYRRNESFDDNSTYMTDDGVWFQRIGSRSKSFKSKSDPLQHGIRSLFPSSSIFLVHFSFSFLLSSLYVVPARVLEVSLVGEYKRALMVLFGDAFPCLCAKIG